MRGSVPDSRGRPAGVSLAYGKLDLMTKFSLILTGFALLCLVLLAAAWPPESKAQGADEAKADLIKRGGQVYKTRCQLCHLAEGKAPTKNMRFSDDEWRHGNKPEDVEKVVAAGVKGTAMMGFKNRLKPEDIKAVSAYVLGLSQPQAK